MSTMALNLGWLQRLRRKATLAPLLAPFLQGNSLTLVDSRTLTGTVMGSALTLGRKSVRGLRYQ